MITLDQIKLLDRKVRKAIDKISSLTNENKMLQNKLDDYQQRIEELEILMDSFKEDQGEIENGIIEALNQLEIIDDDKNNSDIDSEKQEQDQENLEVTSDDEQEDTSGENRDSAETIPDTISEVDQTLSDEPTVNKDNSDIELDIF